MFPAPERVPRIMDKIPDDGRGAEMRPPAELTPESPSGRAQTPRVAPWSPCEPPPESRRGALPEPRVRAVRRLPEGMERRARRRPRGWAWGFRTDDPRREDPGGSA